MNLPSIYELRFHWYRLGNRESLCRLFRIGTVKLTALMPEDDTDRYMRGQMVKIGGILAKRCAACDTARELDYFPVDDARASGCRAVCEFCLRAGRVSKGYNAYQRPLNGSV